jgi:hypothetical protein
MQNETKRSHYIALDYQKHLLLSLTFTLAEGKNDFVTNDNLKAKPFMMD